MTTTAWGWALKTLRTRPLTDLSQVELSQATDVPYHRIVRIETGTLDPNESELRSICKALRVKPEIFTALAERGEPIVEVRP